MSKFDGLKLLKEDSGPRTDSTEVTAPAPPRTPRPIGKRQDPRYQQISAYVRRDLYDEIRKQLIGQEKDFSDLLERWMSDWLSSNR